MVIQEKLIVLVTPEDFIDAMYYHKLHHQTTSSKKASLTVVKGSVNTRVTKGAAEKIVSFYVQSTYDLKEIEEIKTGKGGWKITAIKDASTTIKTEKLTAIEIFLDKLGPNADFFSQNRKVYEFLNQLADRNNIATLKDLYLRATTSFGAKRFGPGTLQNTCDFLKRTLHTPLGLPT